MKRKNNYSDMSDAPPPIPQARIDPRTKRYCATQAEICEALGYYPYQIMKCNPRRYKKKYLDVQDVIDARAKTPGRGRPKNIPEKTQD